PVLPCDRCPMCPSRYPIMPGISISSWKRTVKCGSSLNGPGVWPCTWLAIFPVLDLSAGLFAHNARKRLHFFTDQPVGCRCQRLAGLDSADSCHCNASFPTVVA